MDIINNEDTYTYDVEASYAKDENFKVNLKNKSCVKPHIEKLKQKGYINYIEGKSRTITINKGDKK